MQDVVRLSAIALLGLATVVVLDHQLGHLRKEDMARLTSNPLFRYAALYGALYAFSGQQPRVAAAGLYFYVCLHSYLRASRERDGGDPGQAGHPET